jgi:hypothetical protein
MLSRNRTDGSIGLRVKLSIGREPDTLNSNLEQSIHDELFAFSDYLLKNELILEETSSLKLCFNFLFISHATRTIFLHQKILLFM